MIIRNARTDDYAGITSVHIKSWQETYVGLMPQSFLDNLSIEGRQSFWEEHLRDPSHCESIWVAENQSEEIVGFCSGGVARNSQLAFDSELYAIYLLKEFQGQGVGRSMFNALVSRLKEDGYQSMYLWVVKGSKTIAIYESLGGVLGNQTQTDLIGGEEVEELLYFFHLDDFNQ